MSEIAIPEGMPINKYADEKLFGEVVSSASYLPRVQLFGGNSNLCKEGKIGVGRYGLVRGDKNQVEDMGPEFSFIPFSWRYKAMRIAGDDVMSYYNPKSPDFLKVQAEADTPDSGCMIGIEFLIWLPAPWSIFASLYFASKTARRQCGNLVGLIKERRAATCKVEFIKKQKYSWHGPIVIACSTPVDAPEQQDILDQGAKFANPKDSEVEKVESAADRER